MKEVSSAPYCILSTWTRWFCLALLVILTCMPTSDSTAHPERQRKENQHEGCIQPPLNTGYRGVKATRCKGAEGVKRVHENAPPFFTYAIRMWSFIWDICWPRSKGWHQMWVSPLLPRADTLSLEMGVCVCLCICGRLDAKPFTLFMKGIWATVLNSDDFCTTPFPVLIFKDLFKLPSTYYLLNSTF